MKEFVPDFGNRQVTSAFKQLLLFSILIIGLPLATLFLVKRFVFEDILHYSSQDSILYSAIISVILVHIILGLFVYVAYTEQGISSTKKPESAEKQD